MVPAFQSSRHTPESSIEFSDEPGRTEIASHIGWQWWLAWLLVFGLFSAAYPRDANFDVAHYHLHNGWAALHGRANVDLAPAEMHSFLNPAYQLVVWWLIEHLPGRMVALLLGMVQGLVLPALYVLTRRLIVAAGSAAPRALILAIAAAGFLAEVQFTLFGSLRNDHLGALGFILALIWLLPVRNSVTSWRALAGASLLLGALAGMKLTNAIYILGFATSVMIILPNWNTRLRAALICGLAGLAGLIAIGGPWAWHLWQTTGNPVFPMYNDIFNAPLGPDGSFRDTRYLPGGLLSGLLRPFIFLTNGELINEYDFFDPRYQMAYLAAIAMLVYTATPKARQRVGNYRRIQAVSAGLLITMLSWTYMFSIERYIAAAWLMGPTFLATLIALFRPRLTAHPKAVLPAVAATTLLVLTTGVSENRRAPWTSLTQPYIETQLPPEFHYENSLVLFAGKYPTAFTAPAFPPSAQLSHAAGQSWSAPALSHYRPLIADAIRQTDQPIYAVILDTGTHLAETLVRLRLDEKLFAEPSDCLAMTTSFDLPGARWNICPLRRMSP